MTTYLVTRHEGTRVWATTMAKHKRLPFAIDRAIDHLDPDRLEPGDVVVGTLPIHLVAELQARGVTFWSLDLEVPAEKRGQPLLARGVYHYRARFARYDVTRCETAAVEPSRPSKANLQPGITLIAVSDELSPAAISWLHQPTPQVALLTTPRMEKNSELLKRWFQSRPEPPRKIVARPWNGMDFANLRSDADDLARELLEAGHEAVVVNLTGGTKPMAMALQAAFGQRAKDFGDSLHGPYVDSGRGRIEDLLNPKRPTKTIRSVLNVSDLLALKGFTVRSAQSALPDYEKWLNCTALFECLMDRQANAWRPVWYSILNKASNLRDGKNKKNKKKEGDNQTLQVSWNCNKDEPTFDVVLDDFGRPLWKALNGQFGKVLKKTPGISFTLAAPNRLQLRFDFTYGDPIAFLMGGWMEVWLARRFAAHAGVDDWAQGVKVISGKVDNEFDLFVACGNQLLVVEVKTAKMQRESGDGDKKGTETVYKLEALAEKLGKQFRTSWLVSLHPLELSDLERAQRDGITVVAGDALQDIDSRITAWAGRVKTERDDGYRRSQFKAPQRVESNARPR